MQEISIAEVLEHFGEKLALKLIAGKDHTEKKLKSSDVHRPGLVLAGFVGLFTFDRAQVLGNSEMLYLDGLSARKLRMVLETMFQFDIRVWWLLTETRCPKPW